MIPQDAIKTVIQQQGWKRLLLAVSGGLDSICLAHYFISNKDVLDIEWIGITHVHHGLREGTADRDAKFVQNFADKFKCNFYLKKLDGVALKNANGSLEENARDARYEALRQFASENRANVILTAHHAGDQAETVYLRLRRGVSLAGLRGIQEVRPFEGMTNANASMTKTCALYRPFLNVTRKELVDYASQNNLQWREDESNVDVKFARNLIRHDRLPHLEKAYPGATSQLCRIATKGSLAYEKIMVIADKVFSPLIVNKAGCLILDTKKGKVSLQNGMDEIFRLWLDRQGYRFPIGAFKGKALLNDIRNQTYRTRFIEKNRNIIRIYDKRTTTDI